MSRVLNYIFLLASCFIILAAPTCEGEMDPVDARRDHIYRLEAVSDVFTSESLSEDNLEAFEFKAAEKLMDYADYLGIIYSKGYDESFRQQARQIILGFFDNQENAEASFIPESLGSSFEACQVFIDSVTVFEPLRRETDTYYRGSMRYAEKIIVSGPSDTSLISQSWKTIGISLQMDYKDFGEKSMLVWEVLLGRISAAD